jgi:KipI family sensor histidine kinase inhibitor
VTEPRYLPLGESALTIRLGETASVELAERSAALAAAIRGEALDGVRDVVAAVAAVTVYFADDHAVGPAETARLESIVARGIGQSLSSAAFSTHTVPTRYDGVDLDEVAERVGLTRQEVIRRHVEREYRVLAIGFMPGWAYLGPLDPALALPRRGTPRTRIPGGSVAIMGAQTGIYPRVSPGGWNLIGSSGVSLFDPAREAPSLFRAGDRVRFVPVE